jgi:hypothetical protein
MGIFDSNDDFTYSFSTLYTLKKDTSPPEVNHAQTAAIGCRINFYYSSLRTGYDSGRTIVGTFFGGEPAPVAGD